MIRKLAGWLNAQPTLSRFIITYAAVVAFACLVTLVIVILNGGWPER